MDYARLSATERRTAPPAVAVSTVAFALAPPEGARTVATTERSSDDAPVTLWIPLVQRLRAPYAGMWALPGGAIPWNESLSDTARRTIHETARRAPGYLEQLTAFGGATRSAHAQRLVTIAYWALYGERELRLPPTLPQLPPLGAAPDSPQDDRAEEDPHVAWCSADSLPELAFDHADIAAYALWRLRRATAYSTVAHRFLGDEFTIAQLRSVHEAILGVGVDPANFRRQLRHQRGLVETGNMLVGGKHRPARLYRFSTEPDPAVDADLQPDRQRPQRSAP